MASRRRNRRRGERRAQASRSRDAQRARQSDAEPSPLSRFSLANISTDWIAGIIIGGVVIIAALVFLFAQILRGGGGGVSGFIQISGIAVHPTNPAVVLLADANGLFRSIDGGGVWQPAAFDGEAVRSVAPDPAQAGAFFAAGNGVFARSDDGGVTWRDLAVDLPSADIRAFAADPEGGDLYAFVQGAGLYRSSDGGGTWRAVWLEGEASLSSLAVPAGDPETVFAFHGTLGLVKSDNGGASFDEGVRGGVPYQAVADVKADLTDPDRLYVIAQGRFYRSGDLGESWELVGQGLDDDERLVAVWPGAGVLYAVTTSGEVFASRDNGNSWTLNATGS